MKSKNTQISKIRDEKGDTDLSEIKRITKEYYTQLYDNKLNNLNELYKFIERYKLQKLTPKIEIIDKLSTSKEIKLVIETQPTKENPDPDDFTGEFN